MLSGVVQAPLVQPQNAESARSQEVRRRWMTQVCRRENNMTGVPCRNWPRRGQRHWVQTDAKKSQKPPGMRLMDPRLLALCTVWSIKIESCAHVRGTSWGDLTCWCLLRGPVNCIAEICNYKRWRAVGSYVRIIYPTTIWLCWCSAMTSHQICWKTYTLKVSEWY